MESYGVAPIGCMDDYGGRTDPGNGWLLCDGRAVSRTTYVTLFAAIVPSIGTGTVTIASPGVWTLNAHGLVVGDAVYFTTTGALPTGLSANTRYFVVSQTTNTFQVSATVGGAAVNTSGSQSGTHTVFSCPWGLGDGSTTFNLPDCRGRVSVAPDNMSTTTGAAARLPNSNRALGLSGGEERHTLLAAESGMISHNHGGTTGSGNVSGNTGGGAAAAGNGASANHSHGAAGISLDAGGAHTHNIGYNTTALSTGNVALAMADGSYPNQFPSLTESAGHTHNWGGGGSGNFNSDHSHGAFTVGPLSVPSLTVAARSIAAEAAASAGTAHNNVPPYLASNKVIRAL